MRGACRTCTWSVRVLSRSTLTRTLVVAFALALALAAPITRAHAGSAVSLDLHDVLGERVALPAPARATVLFFMSRRAQDECNAFGRDIDEQLLDAPVESVAFVDVRRYGGWLRRLAESRMKKSALEAREHRRERRIEHGANASSDVVNRWHLVGDFDGALFSQFGVEGEPAHPLAFVLDRKGALRGPFREVRAVVEAVGDATRAR